MNRSLVFCATPGAFSTAILAYAVLKVEKPIVRIFHDLNRRRQIPEKTPNSFKAKFAILVHPGLHPSEPLCVELAAA